MKKLIVVLLLVSMASVASANLLTNPGFETYLEGQGWTGVPADWYVDGSSIYRREWYNHTPGGAAAMTYEGNTAGSIAQTFWGETIAADDVITVSIWAFTPAAPNPENAYVGLQLFSTDGTTSTLLDQADLYGLTAGVWTQISLEVDIADYAAAVGKNPMIRVYASAATIGADVLYLDDASMTVVPEPVTMVLLGLGGLLLRRKRS